MLGVFCANKETKKEIGIYRDFRLYVVTHEDSPKVNYMGCLDKGGNYMPLMKFADSLEILKANIDEYIKDRY